VLHKTHTFNGDQIWCNQMHGRVGSKYKVYAYLICNQKCSLTAQPLYNSFHHKVNHSFTSPEGVSTLRYTDFDHLILINIVNLLTYILIGGNHHPTLFVRVIAHISTKIYLPLSLHNVITYWLNDLHLNILILANHYLIYNPTKE